MVVFQEDVIREMPGKQIQGVVAVPGLLLMILEVRAEPADRALL
jgi:hypothetical protein